LHCTLFNYRAAQIQFPKATGNYIKDLGRQGRLAQKQRPLARGEKNNRKNTKKSKKKHQKNAKITPKKRKKKRGFLDFPKFCFFKGWFEVAPFFSQFFRVFFRIFLFQ